MTQTVKRNNQRKNSFTKTIIRMCKEAAKEGNIIDSDRNRNKERSKDGGIKDQ